MSMAGVTSSAVPKILAPCAAQVAGGRQGCVAGVEAAGAAVVVAVVAAAGDREGEPGRRQSHSSARFRSGE